MRSLNQNQVRTEINLDTGELKRIVTDEFKGYIDQEPEYIKIYTNTQLCLSNLDSSLAPVIIAFGPYMTYADNPKYKHMVQTSDIIREGVASTLGVSTKRVEQLIKKLVENGIFIPIYREKEINGVIKRTKKRGVYFVNPWVIAKGHWKDIKKLQQKIDFVKGASSCYIEDELGERKIQCNLPNNYQYTLEDYQKGIQ
ncbi:MAG: hypothetical protein NC489_31510 [Ruminococcus flavefaciens]|nr:hypothetical protein [Ruminococcus flavefaciens]